MRYLNLLLLIGLGLLAYAYAEAIRDPVVRRATISMRDWPAGAPPLRVVLLSDLHVIGPDTPPQRLARVLRGVDALKPDLVLITGDFLSHRSVATHYYTIEESLAPLSNLHARLGVVAVPGNHDNNLRGRMLIDPPMLARLGVTLLENSAVRRGPLVIAGAGDFHAGHFNPKLLDASAAQLPGPIVMLTHSADPAFSMGPRYGLILSGHTHCGQIVLPLYGAPRSESLHGERYRCGLVRDPGRTFVITAGIGTSVFPLRFGAPPDLWLLTLGP